MARCIDRKAIAALVERATQRTVNEKRDLLDRNARSRSKMNRAMRPRSARTTRSDHIGEAMG